MYRLLLFLLFNVSLYPNIIFDQAMPFKDGAAAVYIDGKSGFIGIDGKYILKPEYEEVKSFNNGAAAVLKNGKWGYVDKAGKLFIKFEYDEAGDFINGQAVVVKDGKVGIIDKQGKIIAPFLYVDIDEEINGMRKAEKLVESKSGTDNILDRYVFINQLGKECGRGYRDIKNFSEGYAAVLKDGYWGYIDKTGNEIIELKYDKADDFRYGYAAIYIDEKWGVINKDGKNVVTPKYDFIDKYCEGMARVLLHEKWGYIDKTGEEIIIPQYDFSFNFKNGAAIVCNGGNYSESGEESSRKFFLIDANGKKISREYDFLFQTRENIILCKLNNKWGIITNEGKEIVSPYYDRISDCSMGIVTVLLYDNSSEGLQYGYIDNKGKRIGDVKYSFASGFMGGIAIVSENGNSFIIDKSGREICGNKYKIILPFEDKDNNYLKCGMENENKIKYGIMNNKGEVLVNCSYDEIISYSEGVIVVKEGLKYGYIDEMGKEIEIKR